MSNFSAVLVGINNYKSAPLRGCVNDVIIMRDILVKKYGVPASSIRLLLDDRATKANIEERLTWLAKNDADNKLFYYSGHGAQIPVQTYADNIKEVDGMNELLCPSDFNWRGNYILDNKIDSILSKMKEGKHMTMVIDSCHSGTIDRHMDVGGTGNISKTIPTPLDILSRVDDVTLSSRFIDLEDMFKEESPKTLKSVEKYSKHNVSILTGCREDQTSADAYFTGRFQGALSYFMQKALLKNKNISLNDLRCECALQLNKNSFTQVPQLLANKENVDKPFIQV